jgi:hypothetical protein
MRSSVLRWNRLKRRAAALGVDVATLIRLDAAQQRETSPDLDDDQREESFSVTRKVAHNRDRHSSDTRSSAVSTVHLGSHGVVDA